MKIQESTKNKILFILINLIIAAGLGTYNEAFGPVYFFGLIIGGGTFSLLDNKN